MVHPAASKRPCTASQWAPQSPLSTGPRCAHEEMSLFEALSSTQALARPVRNEGLDVALLLPPEREFTIQASDGLAMDGNL